jgi:hypothetical protein
MPKVRGPRRPENMSRMMMSLPRSVSDGVMPVLRPTVPSAEAASNRMPWNSPASVRASSSVPTSRNVM